MKNEDKEKLPTLEDLSEAIKDFNWWGEEVKKHEKEMDRLSKQLKAVEEERAKSFLVFQKHEEKVYVMIRKLVK